jgi:uncharacterized membrane protein
VRVETPRLAVWLARVLHWGSVASTSLLALGLVLALLGLPAGLVSTLGLIVLMATPVARVVVSVAEYASQRDWPFVILTSFVLLIVLGSLAIAL